MKQTKTAIVLMNVGSPDSPTKQAVRKFLSEFLNDKRVIDLPWLFRKFLVNCIIVPFRTKKSTALYQQLWTEQGSPLICISENIRNKLQTKLGGEFAVFIGMRYGNPGYKLALSKIKKQGFKRIVVLPLFPQHALATTESALVTIDQEIKNQKVDAEVIKVGQFYQHPGFVKAFANQINKYDPVSYDHLLFSFHGIPNRQDEKSQPEDWNSTQKYSYRTACYKTAGLLSKALNIPETNYSIAFQSRLSKNWLEPFSDEVLLKQIKAGNKRILVTAPSFVTDCLETIVEIAQDYQELFIDKGGEKLQLVPSLNAEDEWVEALCAMIGKDG